MLILTVTLINCRAAYLGVYSDYERASDLVKAHPSLKIGLSSWLDMNEEYAFTDEEPSAQIPTPNNPTPEVPDVPDTPPTETNPPTGGNGGDINIPDNSSAL